jgi:histidinol-phosphate aminotransferase
MNLARPYLKDIERVDNSKDSRLGYLRLDKNENTVGFDKHFIGLLRKEITSDFLTAYPETYPLYAKIARWLGCGEDQIYISAGSDAAIKAVFETFIEPGDKLFLLKPTYAMFGVYARLFRASTTEIDYDKNLNLDIPAILKKIEEKRPKLLCIANPNSPTGTIIEFSALEELIKKSMECECVFLLDEAYHLFSPENAAPLIQKYPNLIITRTFSKAFGLASARLGYLISDNGIVKSIKKVRPMYEANAFASRFGQLVLEHYHLIEANIDAIKEAKKYLERELEDLGIPYFKSHANFILIDTGSFERSLKIGQELYKRKILIKAGFSDEPIKNCIRVTLGNRRQMKYFLKNLKDVWEQTK